MTNIKAWLSENQILYYYYVLFLIFLRLCLGELVTEHNIYKKKKKNNFNL